MNVTGSNHAYRQPSHPQALPRLAMGSHALPGGSSAREALRLGLGGAPAATSPHPPLHQVLRHVRALLNEEKVRMSQAPVGSPERKRRKRNVASIKTYERRLERACGRTLDQERREMAARACRAAAEAAPYWARHQRVDRDIAKVRSRIMGLERRQAALRLRLKDLGAQAKGDAHPVRFNESGKARFEKVKTSLPTRVLGLFRRSRDVSRLTEPEARERLGRIHAELDQCAQDLLRPILRAVHSDQPLRRNQPFVEVRETSGPMLRSSGSPVTTSSPGRSILRDPSLPSSPVSPGGRQVRFDDEAVPYMHGYPAGRAELPEQPIHELPAPTPELPAWPEAAPGPQAYTFRHSMPATPSQPGPAYSEALGSRPPAQHPLAPRGPIPRKPLPLQLDSQSAGSITEPGSAPRGGTADTLPRHPSGRPRPVGPRPPPWGLDAAPAPVLPETPAVRETPARGTAWPPAGHKAGWRPMHWDHAQEEAIRRQGPGES